MGWSQAEAPQKPEPTASAHPDPLAYLNAKGLMGQKPKVNFAKADGVDHRAAFLLTQVDGDLTIEDLIDLSGMGTEVAAALVVDLVERGALVF